MQAEEALPADEKLEMISADSNDAVVNKNTVLTLPVQLMVSVGQTKMTVEELMAIDPETIITLDSTINDPVELLVGERVIARGDLVETDRDGLGVKVTEVVEY